MKNNFYNNEDALTDEQIAGKAPLDLSREAFLFAAIEDRLNTVSGELEVEGNFSIFKLHFKDKSVKAWAIKKEDNGMAFLEGVAFLNNDYYKIWKKELLEAYKPLKQLEKNEK